MIKDVLGEVIDELVSKGILWREAEAQFEKLFLFAFSPSRKGI